MTMCLSVHLCRHVLAAFEEETVMTTPYDHAGDAHDRDEDSSTDEEFTYHDESNCVKKKKKMTTTTAKAATILLTTSLTTTMAGAIMMLVTMTMRMIARRVRGPTYGGLYLKVFEGGKNNRHMGCWEVMPQLFGTAPQFLAESSFRF